MELVRGRYEVVGPVGRGGQARVLRAVDRQHDRAVALKLRPARGDEERRRLLSEARVLFAVRPHAGLPVLREDFFDEGTYVLVMDWIDGVDLHHECRRRGDPGLPVPRVLDWLTDAAAALDHLHSHDPPVAHGDVKPANLVLRPDGHAVLVDFGSMTGGGTSRFAAPEVAAGAAPTPAADIYGLAATALALLTGTDRGDALPSWEGMAPATRLALERALRRGLATDPDHRPPTAGALVELLRSRVADALPAGTVTFVFTDVAGSTPMWERAPAAMSTAMACHDALVADTVADHAGHLVKFRGEGDSTLSVFPRAGDAVRAALALQRNVTTRAWPPDTPLRIRVAVHTGEAEVRDGDYFGTALARAARLRAITTPGTIVLSEATTQLVADDLPPDTTLRALPARSLTGLTRPETPHNLHHPDLPDLFDLPTATDDPTATTYVPSRGAPAVAGNLPGERSTFVGRAREAKELAALVEEHRLVTVVGVGGAGKTRLACHVAAKDHHSYDVVFIGLAGVRDAALVGSTAAAALGMPEAPRRDLLGGITDCIGHRRLLLLVDNCEHLLAGVAELIDVVLDRCPNVRILATSREPLSVTGERTWRLPGLGAAGPGDAVQLFVERARQVHADLQVGDAIDVVEAICKQLDGVPLAIELAAARAATLSVREIAARLDDQVRLLDSATTGERRTLRSTLRWSLESLTPIERDLFLAISVFAGGFDAAGAAAVIGDHSEPTSDIVARLVARSLVEVDRGTHDGSTTRFRVLEPVRQFADEELRSSGLSRTVGERHARHVTERVLAGGTDLSSASEELLAWLEDNLDNARVALRWYLDAGLAGDGILLAGGLFRHWQLTGRLLEGVTWLDRYRDATRATDPRRLRVLLGLGALYPFLGLNEEAEAALGEARQLAASLGHAKGEAWAVHYAGHVAEARGNHDQALALALESAERFSAVGDDLGVAYAWYWAARAETAAGRLDEARAHLDQGLEVADRADPSYRPLLLHVRSLLELRVGQWDAAAAAAQESTAVVRGRGNELVWAFARSAQAVALALLGRPDAAETTRSILPIAKDLADRTVLEYALTGAARIALDRNRRTDAATLLRAALPAKLSGMPGVVLREVITLVEETEGAALPPVDRAAATARGAALTDAEAVALALDVVATATTMDDRSAAPLPARLTDAGREPFVGRVDQLAVVRRWASGASGTAPRVLAVSGEAGIGKTRLVAEAAAAARDAGRAVRYGRCDAEAHAPYQPFAEALGAAVLSTLLTATEGASDAVVQRARRFDAVVAALTDLSPVLVVLDDLHWADGDTVALLTHLVRADAPGVSIALTYRDTDLAADGPLAALLAVLARERGAEAVALTGLDDADIAALASARGADPAAAHTVTRASGGNPLLAVELVLHLREVGDERVPPTVQEAVRGRLARLPNAVGAAVRAGAVEGEIFTLSVVAAVAAMSEDDALDAIEEALRAGLVVEKPDAVDAFRFRHALVRDAVLAGISASRRARMHGAVAAALAATPPAPGRIARMAYHHDVVARALGRDVGRAADLHLEAAAEAEAQRSFDRAADSYRAALDLLGPGAEPFQRVPVLLALGRCLNLLANVDGAAAVFGEAADQARRSGMVVELARAAIGMVGPQRPIDGDYTGLYALLDEAASGLEGTGEEALRFEALASLANRLPDGHPRRLALTEQLRTLAEDRDDDNARLAVARLDFWQWDRPPEERAALGRRLIALAAASGEPSRLLEAITSHVVSAIERGAFDEVRDDLTHWEALANAEGDLFFQGGARQLRASLALLSGDHVAAEGWLADPPGGRHAVRGGATLGFVAWLRGESADLLPLLEATLPTLGGHLATSFRAFVAMAAATAGKPARATDLLEGFAGDGWAAVPPPQDPMRPIVVAFLAEVAHRVGAKGRAGELSDLLAPYADRVACASTGGILGSNRRYAGMLAQTVGDLEAAAAHFRLAIEQEDAMGAVPFAAESRWRLAVVLSAIDRDAHRDEIAQLLHDAIEAGDVLGLRKLQQEARAAAAACSATPG